MFYVYILFSKKDKRTYIGFTNNVVRRLQEHNSGKVRSTKYRRPLKLLKFEKFNVKKQAKNRELWWKSSSGRKKLKDFFQ